MSAPVGSGSVALEGISRRRIVTESRHVAQAEAFHAGKERRKALRGLVAGSDKEFRYRAAEQSTHQSTIGLLGGTADSMMVWGDDYWRIRERVRAYDRDNPLVGQIVDRGLDQVLGQGFSVDPHTDDPELNKRILAEVWEPWADDPDQCDYGGRYTFSEMERLALRHQWIDGDCFAILDDATGSVRMEEGDRVWSPHGEFTVEVNGKLHDLIIGVEIDPQTTRATAYYFAKRIAGERHMRGRRYWTMNDLFRIPREQVIHIYDAERLSQTRGITAFHAVLDRIGLLEDTEYADLVKLEAAACIAGFVGTEYGMPIWGQRTTETTTEGNEETFDEFHPGMIVRLRPGEKFEGFSPRVTTHDTHTQKREIKREIGLAIGLPLELSLLDQTGANFSQARGVLESYKKTARRQQRGHGRKFRSRVYSWKVAQAVKDGRLPNRPDIFKHQLRYPEWAYLDPEKEAKADDLRIRSHLASPRRVWSERGMDYDEGIVEIATDAGKRIEKFHEEAQRLIAAGVPGVTYQEVAAMGLPGLSPGADQAPPGEDEPAEPKKEEKAPND